MTSRRSFIQKLGLGALSPSLIKLANDSESLNFSKDSLADKSWDDIRKLFPLTHNRVYMNNGTFGPCPQVVIDAVSEGLQKTCASGEYGNYDAVRPKIAEFLGIEEKELCLTHNTTEGINIMTWGIDLKQGDEVILCSHDHSGNAFPWLNREKLDGIKLVVFDPKLTAKENLKLIKSLVSKRTKVIAIPHITCTTGLVFPIKEIAEFAKSKGIITAIDGAHGAGTFDLDLHDLGCDMYAGCFHKWMLGPAGTGFLYVRENMIDKVQAIQIGAHSSDGWTLEPNYQHLEPLVNSAHRYDYGTQSTPQRLGMGAAVDFHLAIGKERVEKRVRELSSYLWKGLDSFKEVEILTPKEEESRISVVTFKVNGIDYLELQRKLGAAGFRTRGIYEAGLDAVRVSTHIYNSKKEIDKFVSEVKKIISSIS